MAKFKVGFVGLGIMGKPMAKNVLRAGYDVVAFDFNQEAVDDVVAAGATAGKNGKDVAERTQVVITMLPNSPNVKAALFAEGGIAEGLEEGKAVIDMSSIAPKASQSFAKRLGERGIEFLDAPVSGGEPKARDGSIAIMVGGPKKTFEKYKKLLETMGGDVNLVDTVPGAGNITKLANQMIVAINIAAISEAYTFAKKSGINPESVYNAIRTGLAGSVVMDQKSKKIFNGDFKPGFRVELHIKDLQNALDTAHDVNVSTPFTAQAMEILQSLKTYGHEKEDHSAIAEYYEKINNIRSKK